MRVLRVFGRFLERLHLIHRRCNFVFKVNSGHICVIKKTPLNHRPCNQKNTLAAKSSDPPGDLNATLQKGRGDGNYLSYVFVGYTLHLAQSSTISISLILWCSAYFYLKTLGVSNISKLEYFVRLVEFYALRFKRISIWIKKWYFNIQVYFS